MAESRHFRSVETGWSGCKRRLIHEAPSARAGHIKASSRHRSRQVSYLSVCSDIMCIQLTKCVVKPNPAFINAKENLKSIFPFPIIVVLHFPSTLLLFLSVLLLDFSPSINNGKCRISDWALTDHY